VTIDLVTLCKALSSCLNVLVGFMSKEWIKIDSDITFSGGSVGYTVVYATESVTKVALTGFGYLS
jgi:hypothetical protein